MKQVTDVVLMIRPSFFYRNPETALSNCFQKELPQNVLPNTINKKAQQEFDDLVLTLNNTGVKVLVLDNTDTPDTPDAVFVNNWISFHDDGLVAVYPLQHKSRRLERKEEVLTFLEQNNIVINDVIDFTSAEEEEYYLEGLGSVVLDRVHQKAYCFLSSRSNEELFIEFCEDLEYFPVVFGVGNTKLNDENAINHTDMILCIAKQFAIVCFEAISDKKEIKELQKHLKQTNKEIITITIQQMKCFVGNAIQLKGNNGAYHLLMSLRAYQSLTAEQLKRIKNYNEIIYSDVNTIETYGGGSVCAMMVKVF